MPPLENDLLHAKRVVRINSTAKYNLVTFFPRFLFEQFRRYANLFFLMIALLQQIPDVSPTGRWNTAVPLIFILTVSAVKEIIEDFKRHRADSLINNRIVEVLRGGDEWMKEKWKRINVGDIVRVTNGQFFPADLILLSSSEPQAMSYIETANLDGETNLKIRQAVPATGHLMGYEDLSQFGGVVECEAPNRHLYEFTGNLILTNADSIPLGPSQVLLRGARLRNTKWIFGLVVYTGHDSKLMKNTNEAPLKRSNVDKVVNNQILVLFVVLLVMSLVSAIAAQIWTSREAVDAWYLGIKEVSSQNFGYSFLTFIILYNNLIPISLQVTLEVVRFFQAIFINQDIDMYYEPSDQPAMARTSNLNEELGQVKYIFSDKTGTLTKNVMHFKKCSIAGVIYGSDTDEKFADRTLIENLNSRHVTAPIIKEFMSMMSVCHTVVPEHSETESDKLTYQASSPDERALVMAAQALGFVFHTRKPQCVYISAQGREEKYEIMNVLEFTSERKRMSVIVKCPDDRIKIYVKGADSVIFNRLGENQLYKEVTIRHLEEFASAGYRTLCFAKGEISEDNYVQWKRQFYEKASLALHDRERKLEEAAEEIERNLTLLGASAIEDKLQDGVPETIAALIRADIKIWVLTGDKQETAVNIGHSCKLISPNMPMIIIKQDFMEETRDRLSRYVQDLGPHVGRDNDLALVIDGTSLEHALCGDCRRDFLNLAVSCRVVICCRVTPMQKAEVVELVKKSVGAITLAIGDGANDVAMIQAAHVGIGISGTEGLQAASASDYAIAQFRFLAKLLFVHGAWSFHRMVKMILYSFHKNICLYIIELWFAIYSAWSGQTLFDRWCISAYNVIFTAAPPLAIGLFDRTASHETMLRFPALYKLSQNRESFSVRVFWLWVLNAIYHSILLFWLGKQTLTTGVAWSNGRTGGWLMLGNCIYTYVVVTVCLKAGLEVDAWTWLTHLSIWGSIGLWFVFLVIYANIYSIVPGLGLGADMSGMDQIMLGCGVFWFALILIPMATLLVDFVYKVVRRTLFKTIADEVRELELSHIDPSLIIPKLTRRRVSQMFSAVLTKGSNNRSAKYSGGPVVECHLVDEGAENGETTPHIHIITPGPFGARNTAKREHSNPRKHANNGEMSTAGSAFQATTRRLSETARLLRSVFRRSSSGVTLAEEARHGYAFSQEEHGVVGQSNLIRAYDSTVAKPQGI